MNKHWMEHLAHHYTQNTSQIKNQNTQQKFMILFDIDGTIIDTRYLVQHTLQAFDLAHGTGFFTGLAIEDINCHEEDVVDLLDQLKLSSNTQEKILAWYHEHRWLPEFILAGHQPFEGVFELIAWLQSQEHTEVGLNTARPERLRYETLRSLNSIGLAHGVKFRSEHLFMNSGGWGEVVLKNKVKGIKHFEEQGYRVLAFLDNEPRNLKAVADARLPAPILLMHADTLFQTPRHEIPHGSVGGDQYELKHFFAKVRETQEIRFVWEKSTEDLYSA